MSISIKLYSPSDAKDMHAAVLESVAEVGHWMPWCHPKYSLNNARQWIKDQQKLHKQGLAYEFAIRDEQGTFLGGCGVNHINNVDLFANLGYWIRTSAAGRGIAPEAVRLVADYIFNKTPLIRLEIVCAIQNIRSQRVAGKVGALKEGILRKRCICKNGPSDAVMYSLVKGDT